MTSPFHPPGNGYKPYYAVVSNDGTTTEGQELQRALAAAGDAALLNPASLPLPEGTLMSGVNTVGGSALVEAQLAARQQHSASEATFVHILEVQRKITGG